MTIDAAVRAGAKAIAEGNKPYPNLPDATVYRLLADAALRAAVPVIADALRAEARRRCGDEAQWCVHCEGLYDAADLLDNLSMEN